MRQQFESTLFVEDVKGVELEIKVWWVTYSEKDYGADADGNRGRYAEFVDDLEFMILRKGKNVTENIRKTSPVLFAEITTMAEQAPEGDDCVNITRETLDAAEEDYWEAKRDAAREEK